jgi:hypothetical protein
MSDETVEEQAEQPERPLTNQFEHSGKDFANSKHHQAQMYRYVRVAYLKDVIDMSYEEMAKELKITKSNAIHQYQHAAPFLGEISNLQIKVAYHRLIDGWRWGHVAKECEITKDRAQAEYEKARRLLAPDAGRHSQLGLEYSDAEKVGQAIALTAGRLDALDKVCEAAGMPAAATRELIQKLQQNYPEVFSHVGEVKTEYLLAGMDNVSRKALEALNLQDLTTQSPRDLAIVIDIMTKNANLLRNKPTHILTVEERRSVKEMIPQYLKEAERRGLTIDMDPITGATQVIETAERTENYRPPNPR